MRPGSSAFLVWVVWAPNAPWIGGTSIARPASVANTAALRRAAERIFATALLGSVSKTSVISVSPSSLGFPRPPRPRSKAKLRAQCFGAMSRNTEKGFSCFSEGWIFADETLRPGPAPPLRSRAMQRPTRYHWR